MFEADSTWALTIAYLAKKVDKFSTFSTFHYFAEISCAAMENRSHGRFFLKLTFSITSARLKFEFLQLYSSKNLAD